MVLVVEFFVTKNHLHKVLAVVESTIHRESVDVVVQNGGHLTLLQWGHPSSWIQDKHRNVFLVSETVNGGRSSVTRSSADNGNYVSWFAFFLCRVFPSQKKLKQVTNELEGNVFESVNLKVEYDLLIRFLSSSSEISDSLIYSLMILNAISWKESCDHSSKNESSSFGISAGIKRPPSAAKPIMMASSKDTLCCSEERVDLYDMLEIKKIFFYESRLSYYATMGHVVQGKNFSRGPKNKKISSYPGSNRGYQNQNLR
ncbi:hypothetical protein OGATHE_005143 [Ogataea polymorpha]|uniref:Uncharacterized protein n=1 Tax=Ogataea polymorpha TaxID=460523 RepID=A0A9P8SZV5_9ASCO|nr:hypothetical protein OGATHE_005143 [Ogataea polymorpha]